MVVEAVEAEVGKAQGPRMFHSFYRPLLPKYIFSGSYFDPDVCTIKQSYRKSLYKEKQHLQG